MAAIHFIFDGGDAFLSSTFRAIGKSPFGPFSNFYTQTVGITTTDGATKYIEKNSSRYFAGSNSGTERTERRTFYAHKTSTGTIPPITIDYFGSTEKEYWGATTSSKSETIDAVLCGYKLDTYQWTFDGDPADSSSAFTPPRWPTSPASAIKWSSEGTATRKAPASYAYNGNAKPFYGAGEKFHLRLELCGDKKLIPFVYPPGFFPRQLNQPIAFTTSNSDAFAPQFISSWSLQKPTATQITRSGAFYQEGVSSTGSGLYATYDGGLCSEHYEIFSQGPIAFRSSVSVENGVTLAQPCFEGTCGYDPSLVVYFCDLIGNNPSTKADCSSSFTFSSPEGITNCEDNVGKKCMCAQGFSYFQEEQFKGNENKGILFPNDAAPMLVSKVSRLNVDSFVFSEPALSGAGKTGTTYSLSAGFPSFVAIHWASINAASFKAPFVHTWPRSYTLTASLGEPFRHTITITTTKAGKTGSFSATSERTTHASFWISEAPPITTTLTSASAGKTYTRTKLVPSKTLSAFCPAYLSTTEKEKGGGGVLVTSYGDMSFQGKPKYISEDALTTPPWHEFPPLTALVNLGPRFTTSGFEVLSWTKSASQASSGRSDRVLVDVRAEWGFKNSTLTYSTFDKSTLTVFGSTSSTNSFDGFNYSWLRDQGGFPATKTTTFFYGYTFPAMGGVVVPKFIGNNTAHGLIAPNGYFDFPYEANSEAGQYTPRPHVYAELLPGPGWQDGPSVTKSSSTYLS